MSTSDVPGYKAQNRDELAMGSWAEHEDGSLMLVQGNEGGKVVYMMFDTSATPMIEWRDAMAEKAFKEQFSFDTSKPATKKPKGKKVPNIKWTWHDKTPFPWDRIIDAGAQSGQHIASADQLLTAAAAVAKSRTLKGGEVDPKDFEHMSPKEVASSIIGSLQEALGNLKV